MDRRQFLKAGAAAGFGLTMGAPGSGAERGPAAEPPPPAAETALPGGFRFHHDHILGTSLDLTVFSPGPVEAAACEEAVLDEVERLRRILSTYDPDSEISRIGRSSGPVDCPVELIDVLEFHDLWNRRSDGAVNGRLGALAAAWREAGRSGIEPDPELLARLVAQAQPPGWRLDRNRRTMVRLTDAPIDIGGIGKSYIVGKAAEAARTRVPAVRGLLLDIGGDLAAVGGRGDGGGAWRVGVTDPGRPADNSPPMAMLHIRDRAVATSGGYLRGFDVGGRRHSHIIDPRTGRPADGVASATVVARDSITAGALAAALCVLPPEDGLRLVGGTDGAECLLVLADGGLFRSGGWAAMQAPLPAADVRDGAWPADFRVTVALALIEPKSGKKIRRPYVAVWIEDAAGKPVRTLAVWGNKAKYQKDLTAWWRVAAGNNKLIDAVSRATRAPGKYELVWDGADDKGNPLPAGTYTVRVEVHREYGAHVRQSGKILCGGGVRQSAVLEKTSENEATHVQYGPGGK